MGSAEIKPGEGVVGRQCLTWSLMLQFGIFDRPGPADSFRACSTAGHAAARDEVLTGPGPGNGSSGVERDCLIFAVKYQGAFTNSFSWQKINEVWTRFVFLPLGGAWCSPGRLIACYLLQPSFWQTHVLCVRALITQNQRKEAELCKDLSFCALKLWFHAPGKLLEWIDTAKRLIFFFPAVRSCGFL